MDTKTSDAVEPASADWTETLARSEAEIASGKAVPLEPVLARLRASIARMKAKQARAGLNNRFKLG